MYDNSQYERLKARHDEAYSRKQQAYREQQTAWQNYQSIRDDQVIYWREPGQPKDKWLINEDADIPGKNGECRFKGGHTHI